MTRQRWLAKGYLVHTSSHTYPVYRPSRGTYMHTNLAALANQIVFMEKRKQASSPLTSVSFNLELSIVMVSLEYDSLSSKGSPRAATAAVQVHLNVSGRGYFWLWTANRTGRSNTARPRSRQYFAHRSYCASTANFRGSMVKYSGSSLAKYSLVKTQSKSDCASLPRVFI